MILMPAGRHAKDEQPARPLLASWQSASGFPREIATLLATNDATAGATLLLAIPGHQVLLKGGARASRTDLWALARTSRGLLSIAVEGHVGEPFGPTIAEWQTECSPAKRERLNAVCALLEIDRDCDPAVRYKLFHQTASALLEARRFFAAGAAVIVHSFSATQESFTDFQRFVRLMGGRLIRPGHMAPVRPREGIELAFGWAQG